jgi:hypothetical protein
MTEIEVNLLNAMADALEKEAAKQLKSIPNAKPGQWRLGNSLYVIALALRREAKQQTPEKT